MSSKEWTRYKLGELFDIASGLSKSRKEFGFGYPFLTFKEVFNNYFIPEKLTNLANSTEKERERCCIKKGDIFLTRTSEKLEELGMSSVALKDYKYATFNGFTKRLRLKENVKVKINPEYIGYYARGPKFRNQILSLSSLTTRASLNNSMLNIIHIEIPPYKEQIEIGKILKVLDEKIEVNNQINKKLEAVAQAIFKHWFVDFEFPNENGEPYKSSGGEMVESELGMIPKGWKVGCICDLVKEIVTGKTPSTKKSENYGNQYPFITIPDMHNKVFITKTERYLSEIGNKNQIKKLLPKDSILVSCIATVGLVAINEKPSHTNQQINSVIPNNDEDLYYFYEYLKLMSDKLKAIGSAGSTTLNVNKGEFEKIKYIYPTKQVRVNFDNIINNNFKIIKQRQLENEMLSNIRDTLLPKLMSGEIRVPVDTNQD